MNEEGIRLAKRVAAQLPGYAYDEAQFYDADGAPADVAAKRAVPHSRCCRWT